MATGIVSITLVLSGIKHGDVASESIDATGKLIFKNSMLVLPLILIVLGYFVYTKKYTLNEERFAQIVQELKDRGDITENKE